MKWYWAVFLTIGILAAYVVCEATYPGTVGPLATVVVLVSALWVAADSRSLVWGIGVLLLWPIFFPAYLTTRLTVQADSDLQARIRPVEALGKKGPEGIPALLEVLKDDKDWRVRRTAAFALARIGPEAIPALAKALQDEDTSVRRFAADALSMKGPEAKEAVPALTEALQDEDETVRWSAARALERIKGKL